MAEESQNFPSLVRSFNWGLLTASENDNPPDCTMSSSGDSLIRGYDIDLDVTGDKENNVDGNASELFTRWKNDPSLSDVNIIPLSPAMPIPPVPTCSSSSHVLRNYDTNVDPLLSPYVPIPIGPNNINNDTISSTGNSNPPHEPTPTSRYKKTTFDERQELLSNADSKNTKRNTKYAVKLFKGMSNVYS